MEPYEKKEQPVDMVNHPGHYMSESGLEVIDVIDAFTEDLVGREAAYTANVIKYILRWKKKNGLEDLKKARWYLNRLINYVAPCEEQFTNKMLFNTVHDAAFVMDQMRDRISNYDYVTVAEYISICGLPKKCVTEWEKTHGWYSLSGSEIIEDEYEDDMYRIKLPKPVEVGLIYSNYSEEETKHEH